MNASIIISSYNRFDRLSGLLNQLYSQTTKYDFKVIVLNDGSNDKRYHSIIDEFPEVKYIHKNQNGGREGYWVCFNNLLNESKKFKSDVLIQLDDDFLLCNNFLDRLLDTYYNLNKTYDVIRFHRGVLKHKNENKPKEHTESGVDGGTLFSHSFLESIFYKIDIKLVKKFYGSGVWEYLNKKIKEGNYNVYHLTNSLVYHLNPIESVMHPKARKQISYKTLNFKNTPGDIKKLSILIVNYNKIEYTKNIINDLFNQIDKDFDIWLVDQNSTQNGTNQFLEEIEDQDNIKLIRNTKNEDLNQVWNYFYKTCTSEYLCFLNNDVRVTNNFVYDTITSLYQNKQIGIAIHVTNNINYTKALNKTKYEILSPKLFQGWDFTIRRSLYRNIPEKLRFFGGDDFLFGIVDNLGYDIGLIYSSPIIHYKEVTQNIDKNKINDIHKEDTKMYKKIIKRFNIKSFSCTYSTNRCNVYPPLEMKLTNL